MSTVPSQSPYRWYILALSTLTNTLAAALPSMCMPVLFEEVARDLHLSLVQIGFVWGIAALPGIATVLLGGVIGDRFGPRRVLALGCLLVGVTGAARGLSTGFASLALTMFLSGMFTPFITMNNFKNCGLWFPSSQLGLASGVISVGMAFGFLSSSLISATFLSPWLGGWRNVLFLYGAISLLVSIPWFLARNAPVSSAVGVPSTSIRASLLHVARIPSIWLFGVVILGIGGCVQGMLGYLPLHLRELGWDPARADAALAAFHTVSLVCAIPIALLSDRLHTRKSVLLTAAGMIVLGIGLLAVARDGMVWAAVCLAGMVRDGFMAVFLTAILETPGVGAAYAGTASGMVMVLSGVGNLLSPPIGNSLASLSPGAPFLFWSGMALLGVVALAARKEKTLKGVEVW
jgi:MFS family permease